MWLAEEPRPQGVRLAYMNPAKSEESKIILNKENFFFILCVTIIRPTILPGDENMRDCEFISHLQRRNEQVIIPWGSQRHSLTEEEGEATPTPRSTALVLLPESLPPVFYNIGCSCALPGYLVKPLRSPS